MVTNPAQAEIDVSGPEPERHGRIRILPLAAAIVIMVGITIWPGALSGPGGGADHRAAMALFWAMSAGFVSGVGFRPRFLAWRWLLSGTACLAGIVLAVLSLQWPG
ncbi:MAG: hypothetical protein CVU28_02780 [Betaproteobacteria bacterium HGW-Betaproteobacteria-21]|nr:MAG: hypothetical protein CVU28_02780 [Betaproteobacteria bacterium HGW-Betaproteobacteria-21]